MELRPLDELEEEERGPVGTATSRPPGPPEGPWRPLGEVPLDGGLVTDPKSTRRSRRSARTRTAGSARSSSGSATSPASPWRSRSRSSTASSSTRPASRRACARSRCRCPPASRATWSTRPTSRATGALCRRLDEGPNFLDAADFASEYIDQKEPTAVEIERKDGGDVETVWLYSPPRAPADALIGRSRWWRPSASTPPAGTSRSVVNLLSPCPPMVPEARL